MTERFEISRRKALTALGTIGVASAGAGLGTSALFNDTESFEKNILTAGTLDLLVDYYSYWDQGSAGSGTVAGTADGEAVTAELGDVKPGDSGLIAFCPRIETNPAYLWMCGALTDSSESTGSIPDYTEPEPVDENGEGELEENVLVDVNYCEVGEVGEGFDPSDVTTVATAWSGTLAELLVLSQTGLPLDGDATVSDGMGFPNPGEQVEFDPDGNYCICLDWNVPIDVENEIQGDSMEFDIEFYAEQARHNDGSTNPCVDETFTSDEVYVHRTSDLLDDGNKQVAISDINDASADEASKLEPIVINASYGEYLVVFDIHPTLGMEDPANMAIGFDPEADGGAWDNQVLYQTSGPGFTYLENGGISDDPANIPGVWAAYDSSANKFTVAVRRSSLEAGGNDFRFAMQSIHEPGAPNNPLNPGGSNARVDAELPSGFDWGDTSTWQETTLP